MSERTLAALDRPPDLTRRFGHVTRDPQLPRHATPAAGAVVGSGSRPVHAILINLDRSPDRLALMQAGFARAGLAFERFPAVLGANVPEAVRSYFCDASGTFASPLRAGEIGRYASHLMLWQRIARGDCGEVALVCEDDLVLGEGLTSLVAAALEKAPQGWHLIRLAYVTKRAVARVRHLYGPYSLVRFSRQPLLSGAYLITREGAARLLKPGVRCRPVNSDLSRPWVYGIDAYGISPPPIRQLAGLSLCEEMRGRLRVGRNSRPYPLRGRRKLRQAAARFTYAVRTLGPVHWAACAADNAWRKMSHRRPQP